jgi:hypothetical protein
VPVTGQPAPISFEPIPPLPSLPPPQPIDNNQRPQPAPGDVRPAFLQQPLGPDLGGQTGEDNFGYQIQLEPPGPQRLFRLESEAGWQERVRQEARQRKPMEHRVVFPDEPILSRDTYAGRQWPKQDRFAEPNYVCYGRLNFEQINLERYGWDLGFVSPFVSGTAFFCDVATWPYHAWTDPCRCYECSAGYCLPGDPIPFLLYPPGVSLTGALAEGGVAVALFAIFP